MHRSAVSVAIGATLAFLLASGLPLAAAHHSGNVSTPGLTVSEPITLPVNNYRAYAFSLASSEQIRFDIQVTSGDNIDMYIVPPAGFQQYTNDAAISFNYLYQLEDRQVMDGTYVGAIGQVTVIVDNVDFSGAVPTGPVTVSISLSEIGPPGPPLIFFVVMGIVLAVVVAMLIWVWTRAARKKRAPLAPPGQPPPFAPPPR